MPSGKIINFNLLIEEAARGFVGRDCRRGIATLDHLLDLVRE
jgi:hypothetical protein